MEQRPCSSTPSSRQRAGPLKFGCANVRGLAAGDWDAAVALIRDGTFDILFLLETWHMDRKVRSLHTYFLAHTALLASRPDAIADGQNVGGHATGGITVLCAPRARSAVIGTPVVSSLGDAITVRTVSGSVAAVYLPPRMPETAVTTLLASLSHSCDAIVGDVNVRFYCDHVPCQAGSPGPKLQLASFTDWMSASSFSLVLPSADASPDASHVRDLGVDHCFTRRGCRTLSLELPTSAGLGFDTDHVYAISLTLNASSIGLRLRAQTVVGARRALPRYRIRLLLDEDCAAAARDAWRRYRHLLVPPSDPFEGVVMADASLVRVCQLVSQTAVGLQRDERRHRPRALRRKGTARGGEGDVLGDDDVGAEALYKQTCQSSGENGALVPTEAGLRLGTTALDEVYERLAARFTAKVRGMPTLRDVETMTVSGPDSDITPFSTEEVVAELGIQGASKACGPDGVHIRLLKVLSGEADFIAAVVALYNACLACSETPTS